MRWAQTDSGEAISLADAFPPCRYTYKMTVQGFNWHLWSDDAILCVIIPVIIRCHNLALFLVILTLLNCNIGELCSSNWFCRRSSMLDGWVHSDWLPKVILWLTVPTTVKWNPFRHFWACSILLVHLYWIHVMPVSNQKTMLHLGSFANWRQVGRFVTGNFTTVCCCLILCCEDNNKEVIKKTRGSAASLLGCSKWSRWRA